MATSSATVDGYLSLPGVVTIAAGAEIDTYYFYPGTRTLRVSSADNLGNAMEGQCTFEIHATLESLLNNVRRAASEGLIRDPGIATALSTMIRVTMAAQRRGASSYIDGLRPFVLLLEAQRGIGVETGTANRFIAYARDLMAITPSQGGAAGADSQTQ